MDGKRFLGAVTETDLIQAVQGDARGFTQEVRVAANENFPRIQVKQKVETLFSLMEMETAVAVMHEDTFLGLVTRSDLLNRLRLKAYFGK